MEGHFHLFITFSTSDNLIVTKSSSLNNLLFNVYTFVFRTESVSIFILVLIEKVNDKYLL